MTRARLPSVRDPREEETTPPSGTVIPPAALRSSQHDASVIAIVREELRDLRSRVGRVEGRVDAIDRKADQLEDEQENTKTGREKEAARKEKFADRVWTVVQTIVALSAVALLAWAAQRMQCIPTQTQIQIERKP